jgi:hypothetical protein
MTRLAAGRTLRLAFDRAFDVKGAGIDAAAGLYQPQTHHHNHYQEQKQHEQQQGEGTPPVNRHRQQQQGSGSFDQHLLTLTADEFAAFFVAISQGDERGDAGAAHPYRTTSGECLHNVTPYAGDGASAGHRDEDGYSAGDGDDDDADGARGAARAVRFLPLTPPPPLPTVADVEQALLRGAGVLSAAPGHTFEPWVLAVPLALLAVAVFSAVRSSGLGFAG